MIKLNTAEQLEVILDECIFTAQDPEMHSTATSVATEQIMQLIDSAITEAVIKQLKLITEHPEDGCVWGVKQVGKRTHEALEWHEAQLKSNTTKQENIKGE